MGPHNKYVNKLRGKGGQKMSVLVHAQGIKTVHVEGGGEGVSKQGIITHCKYLSAI